MIRLVDVSIHAGQFALQRVYLEIPSGRYAALMGRTGQGKTTLLETICGLRRVTTGQVIIDGVDVTTWSPSDRGIGYVPQDLALFPTMTVREHLAFALRLRKYSFSRIKERTDELAELLRITTLLDRRVKHLSGGESQRVALGRALSFHPAVLLLDEPLSALDEETRTEMHLLLKQVQQTTKVTTLHITHSSEEAAVVADCRFKITSGQVRQVDVDQRI